jgi:hypothetical protein
MRLATEPRPDPGRTEVQGRYRRLAAWPELDEKPGLDSEP